MCDLCPVDVHVKAIDVGVAGVNHTTDYHVPLRLLKEADVPVCTRLFVLRV